ncbi:MAG: 2-C-methyl-D-erythritol 4-phosphate cytidylyltransferase [Eubacterium ramulus]
MVTAIILAGGVGSRVGAGRPKQFIEVLGKPVLAYTIEIFQNNPQIDAIEGLFAIRNGKSILWE